MKTKLIEQEDSWGRPPVRGLQPAPESALSLLVLTRRVGGAVLDLLVQLCGGDGGAVVVGMLSGAFPGGDDNNDDGHDDHDEVAMRYRYPYFVV